MKSILSIMCAVALVTLTSFAVISRSSSTAVIPGPIKLADLPLNRAFHASGNAAFLGAGNGNGFQSTFPSTDGILLTQVAVWAFSQGGVLKIEVDGALVDARIIGGSWGGYGALMQTTDSFRFDPPIVVPPGSTLRIRGDSDSLGFSASLAGWSIHAGEL